MYVGFFGEYSIFSAIPNQTTKCGTQLSITLSTHSNVITFLHMLYISSRFLGFAKKAGVSTVM